MIFLKMIRILICGSRTINNKNKVFKIFEEFFQNYDLKNITSFLSKKVLPFRVWDELLFFNITF